MDIGTISRRYAKALFRYACENHTEDDVYVSMIKLSKVLMLVPDFLKALNNPILDKQRKLLLLSEAAENNSNVITRFFNLVLKQKRERFLLFIVNSYLEHYRRKKNIYIGKLTTAVPIDVKTEESICKLIEKATSSRLEFNSHVDENIQGGFILQIDSMRIDASIEGQLNKIRKQFNELNSRG